MNILRLVHEGDSVSQDNRNLTLYVTWSKNQFASVLSKSSLMSTELTMGEFDHNSYKTEMWLIQVEFIKLSCNIP